MPIIGCMKEPASVTETFSVPTNIWSVTNAMAHTSRTIITAFLFPRAQTAHRLTLSFLVSVNWRTQKDGDSRPGRNSIKALARRQWVSILAAESSSPLQPPIGPADSTSIHMLIELQGTFSTD